MTLINLGLQAGLCCSKNKDLSKDFKELFSAVQNGDLERIKTVVEKQPLEKRRAFINTPCYYSNNFTPLHVAVMCGHDVHSIEYLIDQGADIHALCSPGGNPLQFITHCPSYKKLDIIRILVERGALVCWFLATDRETKNIKVHIDRLAGSNHSAYQYLLHVAMFFNRHAFLSDHFLNNAPWPPLLPVEADQIPSRVGTPNYFFLAIIKDDLKTMLYYFKNPQFDCSPHLPYVIKTMQLPGNPQNNACICHLKEIDFNNKLNKIKEKVTNSMRCGLYTTMLKDRNPHFAWQ